MTGMGSGPSLSRFGFAWEGQVLASGLEWRLPSDGLVRLIGPAGSGKSVLSGIFGRHSFGAELRTWGELTWGGLDWRIRSPAVVLRHSHCPGSGTVVRQLLGFMPDQQLVSLQSSSASSSDAWKRARSWAASHLARSECEHIDLDSDCADLSLGERQLVALACVRASPAPMIVVDGMVDSLDAEADARFHRSLRDDASRRLVVVTSRDEGAGDEDLVLSLARDSAAVPQVPPRPPDWFRWVVPERLGGMPRPGLVRELGADIEVLAELGVQTVISLEEEAPHRSALERAGFEVLHEPVVDMEAPTSTQAKRLCSAIRERVDRGAAVAVHCRAGLGRTGTVLAACLIDRGYTATQAVTLLRQINPWYIQSEEQRSFIEAFARPEPPLVGRPAR
jgi:atypical dual specificity phosphatase